MSDRLAQGSEGAFCGRSDEGLRDFEDPDPGSASSDVLDPSDLPEEVRDAVDRKMREYEQRWVDEPVPALGGLTPRQALNDPTRREDLMALLREMRVDPPFEGLGMSAERIEAILGIVRR